MSCKTYLLKLIGYKLTNEGMAYIGYHIKSAKGGNGDGSGVGWSAGFGNDKGYGGGNKII